MAVAVFSPSRVSVGGKFFRLGEKKFYAKGVSYGPFAPNAAGRHFASPEQTEWDFAQIHNLGANLIRVYHVPEKWLLDLALEHELKVLIDISWNQHVCFLDSPQAQEEARDAVRRAVLACGKHEALFGFSVANEIPPDVVRWSGARPVADFIDDLVREAKRLAPGCLCTYTNFPPTEFLHPRAVDFVCFNVYLHNKEPFSNYLARLHMLADSKPVMLGEIGVDSLREGEPRKAEMLGWQIEGAFRCGLAGAVVFSYTDDWWKDGRQVDDWQMGLTTRERRPKASFAIVQEKFRAAPYFPLSRTPKVSVVVACYNGERTLKPCLESLQRLNYPDYEIILVDDGSTDATSQIAFLYPKVRCLKHEKNLGLSAARNTGIAAATGEIIAFTDSDCRADPDWLYYLVADLLERDFAGMGGPNLLPPEDSAVAAAVMVSPGGPAHVMLTDRQAEHVPGCNMAFFKWGLTEIGGFDPVFRQAGDDVDLCWRLQQAGNKIGLSHAAFVWHYRRSTVGEYLRQQQGYGEAEALLVRKHPEYFNSFGGSIWRGRIYTASKFGVLLRPPIIYRGFLGSAGFQSLYASEPALTLMLCTTVEFHVLVTLPLWILSAIFHNLLALAVTSSLVPFALCIAAGAQAEIPKDRRRAWSRPLVALLFYLQPIVRGWARYRGRLLPRRAPIAARHSLESLALRHSRQSLKRASYQGGAPLNRFAFVADVLRRLDRSGWPNKADIGWSEFDVEIYDTRWCKLQLTTVTEDKSAGEHLLHCRLRTRWSLRAKVAFWALCGLELLVLGFVAGGRPWLWLTLLSMPIIAWLLHRQQRNLQSLVIAFLDEIGKDWKLTRISSRASPPSAPMPSPVSDPSSPFTSRAPAGKETATPNARPGSTHITPETPNLNLLSPRPRNESLP